MGRNTQGVRLIRLDEGDRLVGISRVEPLPDDEGGPVDGGPVDARRSTVRRLRVNRRGYGGPCR